MWMCAPSAGGASLAWKLGEGTIKTYLAFNCKEDCKVLNAAMKGLGTDEDKIIHIVANRSNKQRQELKTQYKASYGKDLIQELKSELGGKFEDAVIALFRTTDEFDAWSLYDAMYGAGTNNNTLVEIMCSRSNEDIKRISEVYKVMTKKDLSSELAGETSGSFKNMLVALSQAKRPEGPSSSFNYFAVRKARKDAEALYRAGEKTWGTNESVFQILFSTRSLDHLDLVADQYHKLTKKTLEQAIKNEFSGAMEKGMLAIVKCAKSRKEYFAECLYESMKGMGTDDKKLIRLIVSRSECDLVEVKTAFEKKYKKTLERFVAEDISGDYKKLMIEIVRGNSRI